MNKKTMRLTDFVKIIENMKPTVSKDDIQKYEQWTSEYGKFYD